ncbi:MAG: 5-bromo-4-chloroindolyl phosphate hydrolysis family protein [Oscillibacter sp.]|jgi:DNA-binding Lrp family transcriptional regulator|nr:5-bromo-4-chloroindolyl phosphate hydrolysis family protein [Oscillibacter sp.]
MAAQTNPNRKKDDSDWGSWVLIVLLFTFNAWWLALPILFIKLFAPDRRRQSDPKTAASAAAASIDSRPSRQENRAGETARKMTRSPVMKGSNARILRIAGLIVAAAGLYLAAGPAGAALAGQMAGAVWGLLKYLALTAGGLAMFFSGLAMERSIRRYNQYLRVIGALDAVPVEQLASKLGYSEKQVIRDLQRMIEKGCFGDTAYLNMEQRCFFRSGQADAAFQQRRREEQSPPPREAEEGYSGILRNIRRANDQIADPELSAKIDRLEEIATKIFRAVEEDPQKRGRIDTFLNYYLPTTQKLLDSYAEFESTGVEGENLRAAKENIKKTMDSVVAGFAHQLDELYKADAMDVNSDIRVMETMLRRDTSTVGQDFHLETGAGGPRVDLGGTAAQREEKT